MYQPPNRRNRTGKFFLFPFFIFGYEMLLLIDYFLLGSVRTRFDLNPEQEWTQAHEARAINLQSAGEKASLNLGPRSWIIALEGKSYTYISVLKVSSDMPEHYDLRILNSLSFLFFLLSFFLCPLIFFFLRIIYYDFFTVSSIHMWIRRLKSFFSISLVFS